MKFKGMTFCLVFEEDACRKWAEMVMGRNDQETSVSFLYKSLTRPNMSKSEA